MSTNQVPKRKAVRGLPCPACSGKLHYLTAKHDIYECKKCGCLHGRCYLGDSYALIKPYFSLVEVPQARWKPFDLECVGSQGVTRRHGWYDTETRLIVQVG